MRRAMWIAVIAIAVVALGQSLRATAADHEAQKPEKAKAAQAKAAETKAAETKPDAAPAMMKAQLPPLPPANADSIAKVREKAVEQVLEMIGDRGDEPAENVFKDIQILKGMPAKRVPMIMNFGFGRGLGVGCDHCHVSDGWEKDGKPTKEITREMWKMAGRINGEMLPAIKNLRSERPAANCTTCHRGQVVPATNL